MEAGRIWFLALWRNPLATTVLYGALTTHLGLAFYSLYRCRHLRMPLWEALQLVLGLTIPLFLAAHIAGTRLAHELFDVKDSYSLIVLSLWNVTPLHGIRQAILVIVAWLHGCIGFHFWLRLRPWYSRVAPVFFSVALLLPVLALLGFAEAGREISDLMARQPDWFDRTLAAANVPRGSQRDLLALVQNWVLQGYVAILALVLLARAVRNTAQRRNRIRITYPSGLESGRSAWADRPRSQSFCGNSSHLRLWWKRPLLDLSCSRCAGMGFTARGKTSRASGSPTGWRASQCEACLSTATDSKSIDHAARAGKRPSLAWLHAALLSCR